MEGVDQGGHAVGDPRPGGNDSNAGDAGHARSSVRREHSGGLAAAIDHPYSVLPAAHQDRRNMAAAESENLSDTFFPEHVCDDRSAVHIVLPDKKHICPATACTGIISNHTMTPEDLYRNAAANPAA